MEFSYGVLITVARVFKINKVGVYPTNGVQQIHTKSVETKPNNSKICNISFPKIVITMINQKADKTHLYPYQHDLTSSFSCSVYTNYIQSYLKRLH